MHSFNPALKSSVLASALALTGCNIAIEKVGNGNVRASTGDNAGCVHFRGSSSEELISRTCYETYATAGAVTFTPEPDDGHVFYGWGESCSGTDTCKVSPPTTGAKRLVAFFYPENVAQALDQLNIEDMWAKNCIADAMIQAGTTDLSQITTAECSIGHPSAPSVDLDLSSLAQMPNLNTLSLIPTPSTSVFLLLEKGADINLVNPQTLQGFNQLDSLTLGRTSFDNSIISSLPVTKLNLIDTQAASLDFLANMPQLTELTLDSHENLVNQQELANLTQLPNLVSFGIPNNGLFDIAAVPALPNLTSFYAQGNYINDISNISTLPSLQRLNLESSNINSLNDLATLTHLTHIDISSTDRLKGDLNALVNMIDLEELDMNNSYITSLEGIEQLDKLRVFKGAYIKVTEVGPLANKPALEELNLSGAGTDTEKPDISLFNSNSYPNLKSLRLGNLGLTDVTVLSSHPFPALEYLNLNDNAITNIGGIAATSVPNLKSLNLSRTHVYDISPFFAFTQLDYLEVKPSDDSPDKVDCDEREALRDALPNTTININCVYSGT